MDSLHFERRKRSCLLKDKKYLYHEHCVIKPLSKYTENCAFVLFILRFFALLMPSQFFIYLIITYMPTGAKFI